MFFVLFLLLFLFYNILKENMFTIEMEDGRESPLHHTASVYSYSCSNTLILYSVILIQISKNRFPVCFKIPQ